MTMPRLPLLMGHWSPEPRRLLSSLRQQWPPGAVVPGADVDVVEPLQLATSMQSRAAGTIAAGIVFM